VAFFSNFFIFYFENQYQLFVIKLGKKKKRKYEMVGKKLLFKQGTQINGKFIRKRQKKKNKFQVSLIKLINQEFN
jgi:hypothetical protein